MYAWMWTGTGNVATWIDPDPAALADKIDQALKPQLPAEVWQTERPDPDRAMDAVRAMSAGQVGAT